MKKLLKYLFPLIAAVAFWNCSDAHESTVAQNAAVMISEEASCDAEISASDAELCIPRQVSYANPHSLQSTARRVTGTQRNNVEFTKSGRIINAGIIYSVQRKSITVLSSHVEPAHRLLCLGKLII
ncbi:MAG: hypothetical protein IJ495_02605 [Bacteroidales bacterium]|nr:hypothetical protein [Bacteroidales bacterium]